MSEEMIYYGLFGKRDMVPVRRIMAGLGSVVFHLP